MTSQQTMVTLPSGAVVHRWTPPAPRASMVFQHGFGEYAERYVDQSAQLIPRLVGAGVDVWALDMWGHGRSPGRRGIVSTQLAVLDHLAVRDHAALTGLPVFLVGHSLGGLVTACSAHAAQNNVAGVVLMGPALSRPEPALVRRFLGAVAAVLPWAPIPRRRRPAAELSRIAAVGQAAEADPMMFHGQVPVLTAATALDEADKLWAGLADWWLPTLVLHGTADTYTDPHASTDFVAGISSTDKTLELVDGAFHEILNDLCAVRVVHRILHWLDTHL